MRPGRAMEMENREDMTKYELLSLLDLEPEATFEEVRRRVINLNLVLHPDRNGNLAATERLKIFNDVFRLLKECFNDEDFEQWRSAQVSEVFLSIELVR